MVNQIKLKCPTCGCEDADVMLMVEISGVKKIHYRCLASGKKHKFQKSLTDDKQYQQFFKKETYE